MLRALRSEGQMHEMIKRVKETKNKPTAKSVKRNSRWVFEQNQTDQNTQKNFVFSRFFKKFVAQKTLKLIFFKSIKFKFKKISGPKMN